MRNLYLLLAVVILWSCNEEDLAAPEIGGSEILVLNEGNFSAGNGTINVFDEIAGNAQNTLYEAGATIQTADLYDGRIYLITNAPDHLDILAEDFSLISRIDEGLDNPIAFAAVDNMGFITNWGDINTAFSDDPESFVAVIDLDTYTIVDSVLLDHRPQRIVAWGGKLYIANEGSNTVSILDPNDLSIVEVEVAIGPSNLVADSSGSIWVLCTSGHLVEITVDNIVGDDISGLVTAGFNEKMAIDQSGNSIYFLGGSNDTFTGQTTVYAVDLQTLQVSPIIDNGFAFYAVGVDPITNEIYVGDSNAFQSTGTGFKYDIDGSLLNQFPTGIGPNGFLFR